MGPGALDLSPIVATFMLIIVGSLVATSSGAEVTRRAVSRRGRNGRGRRRCSTRSRSSSAITNVERGDEVNVFPGLEISNTRNTGGRLRRARGRRRDRGGAHRPLAGAADRLLRCAQRQPVAVAAGRDAARRGARQPGRQGARGRRDRLHRPGRWPAFNVADSLHRGGGVRPAVRGRGEPGRESEPEPPSARTPASASTRPGRARRHAVARGRAAPHRGGARSAWTGDGAPKNHRVAAGERVAVEAIAAGERGRSRPPDFEVVYEDEHLLVVDKPAGLVTHPAPGHAARRSPRRWPAGPRAEPTPSEPASCTGWTATPRGCSSSPLGRGIRGAPAA